jgi:hypothetical protein
MGHPTSGRASSLCCAISAVAALAWGNAQAASLPPIEQGMLCRSAVRQAEAGSTLPPNLLAGIARVETGRRDPVSGRFSPWPWSINAQGRDSLFDTKAEAIAFARQLQAQGISSFDVGCMQVNLMYHPDAFSSLDEAFDPVANARYAVKFLNQLHQQTGSWETASAWYHSANPEEGGPYRAKVVLAMAEESKGLAGSIPQPQTVPFSPSPGASAQRSMPGPAGATVMLAGAAGRAATSTFAGAAPSAMAGRGLDAYRMQPVALRAPRIIAGR